MNEDLITKLALGKIPTQEEIEQALFEICDRVHASCDDECPVYRACDGVFPQETEHGQRYSCDGFKRGSEMAKILKAKAG